MNVNIEQLILRNLISNDQFMRKTLPFIKPEYFEGIYNSLFKEVTKFVAKYNKLPTAEAFKIELDESPLNDEMYATAVEMIPTIFTKEEIDNVFSKLTSNYGVAGPIFIEYVITHMEAVIDMIYRMQAKIDRECNLDQADRYYSIGLACNFTGALIAQRLGLHDIDIGPVLTFIKGELELNRSMNRMATSSPESIALEAVGTFVNENINNILVAPYNMPGSEMPQRPAVAPKGPLKMRYDPNTKELSIAASDLRAYFTLRQIDVKEATAMLAKDKVLKHDGKAYPVRLGSGAVGTMNNFAVRCFVFDGDAIGIDHADFGTDAS